MTKPGIGEFLREQRRAAQLSLRQLADRAGVSNPYLSQIERGLRRPSAEVLQQIAKALRMSSEVLYVRAGLLDEPADDSRVEAAVLADPWLSEPQKRALLEVYTSFRAANVADAGEGDALHSPDVETDVETDTEIGAEAGTASGRTGEPSNPPSAVRTPATSQVPPARNRSKR